MIEINSKRLNQSLEKLSNRQDRPLRENDEVFKTVHGIELPQFVKRTSILLAKTTIKDRIIETHFRKTLAS